MPNTWSRTRIGTPRNDRIGGWFGREPEAVGVLAEVGQPQRLGVDDEQPEDAVALGQVADGAVGLVVDADGDELRQPGAGVVEHTEGAVAGVDEVDRRSR